MAFRNRTALFIQYRRDRVRYKPANDIEMTSPPFWVQYCQAAEDNLQSIRDTIPQLQELHKDIKTTFDDDDTEQDVEILTAKISELFDSCKRNIRKIGVPPPGTKETPDETKLRQNAQISLATTLQDLSQAFRKIQSKYLERLNGTETTFKTLTGNQILEVEEDDPYIDKAFNEEQQQILEHAEELAQSRNEEITQIAQSINQLAQIFRDMHVMVLEQGTILDRIDYNIEKVVTYTEEAVSELKEADKSQKSYRKKLCILLLIVVVVALALFLMIRPKSSGDTPTQPPANRSVIEHYFTH